MKRFIASTTLALGIAGGLASTTPANAENVMCADVYDDNADRQVSSDLTAAIGQLAASGIEAHVQILSNGEALGIRETSDTEKFAEDLATECGWNDKKRVNIIISKNPKAYDVFIVGALEKSVDKKEKSRVTDSLVEDLQDNSTGFQADAVQALKAIEAADKTVPAPKTPSKPIDIPFQKIGLGLGAAIVLSGGGIRLKRGHDVRKLYKNTVTDAPGRIFETASAAEMQLSGLHNADAQQLRQLVNSGKDAINSLEESRSELSTTYRQQRMKLWPSVIAVEEQAEEFNTKAAAASGTQAMMAEELEQIQGFVASIELMDAQLADKFAELDGTISQLQSSGWNLTGTEKTIALLRSKRQTIVELRKSLYIEKPAELIGDILPSVDDTLVQLKELPNDRAEVDRELDKQADETKRLTSVVERTEQTLRFLKQGYDDSCVSSVAQNAQIAKEKIALLNRLQQSSSKLRGKQDYDALQQGIGINTTFVSIASEVTDLTEAVDERVKLLEVLQEELPGRIDDAKTRHASAVEFAISQYPEDVEPSTKDSIKLLLGKLSDVDKMLAKSTPEYLDIDAELSRISKDIDTQAQKANMQRTEMEQLRSDSVRLEQDASAKLTSLTSYISSNRTNVRNISASGYKINQANTTLSRAELRKQVEQYTTITQAISAQRKKAEQQVRAAEEERRRQEEEERRRRAAALSSSSSYGSGGSGSHSSGGYGGGSHSSGDFGGGSHSSGSW